jgi:predicted enzyme related to lactoylglutathione lyase
MKGDDARAAALAAYLERGLVAEEIEPLVPAVHRLRALLAELAPDPSQVAALAERLANTKPAAAPVLATIEIAVQALDAAVRFYSEVLGYAVTARDRSSVELDLGALRLRLRHGTLPGDRKTADLCLELVADDLEAFAARSRDLGYAAVATIHRTPGGRRRCVEVHDPDGRLIRVWSLGRD